MMNRLNSLFWCGYLIWLVILSVHSQRFDSPPWLAMAGGLYLFSALYALAVAAGMRFNWRALYQARWVLLLLALALLWLLLQTILPGSDKLLPAWSYDLAAPQWYQPDTRVSVAPIKTLWLFWSGFLVWVWMVLSISLIDSRRRLKHFLWTLIAVGGLHALVGVSAAFNGILLVDVQQVDGHFRNARGWFVNRNHYSAFVSLTLLGSMILVWRGLRSSAGNKTLGSNLILSWRLVPVLAVLVSLMAMLQSGSRAGIGALMLIAFIAMGVYQLRNGDILRHWRLLVLGSAGLVVTMILFGELLLPRVLDGPLSLGERWIQWQLTLQTIMQAPIAGFGGGSYGTVFQAVRETAPLRDVVYNQSHNDYLHIWLEQGIIGLALWLSALWLTARHILAELKRQSSSLVRQTLIVSAVVLTAALVQAAVDFNLQIINIRCYFFAIMALVFSAPTIHQYQARAASGSDAVTASS